MRGLRHRIADAARFRVVPITQFRIFWPSGTFSLSGSHMIKCVLVLCTARKCGAVIARPAGTFTLSLSRLLVVHIPPFVQRL